MLFICLWLFENFPLSLIICGILATLVQFLILRSFPYISFLSPNFLIGIVLIVINHYLSFQYFAANYYVFAEVGNQFIILNLCYAVMLNEVAEMISMNVWTKMFFRLQSRVI